MRTTGNFFLEILGELPELAPDNESHLLKAAGEVREVQYSDSAVSYTSDAAGTDTLKLSFTPGEVRCGGTVLPNSPAYGQNGWTFQKESQILCVTRRKGRAQITR